MRLFVSIAMLFIWLGYCLMPAMAAEPGHAGAMANAAPHHHQTGMMKDAAEPATHPGCPNCPGMAHAVSCPGCLTALPQMPAGQAGLHPFRYPAPEATGR